MRQVPSWDDFYLGLANYVAVKSKDKHTQVGAAIVDKDNNLIAVGYNGLPRNVNDTIPERYKRPEKYFWMAHSEINCIFTAARLGTPLIGHKLYCSWTPCVDCAKAIIQVGISEVIVDFDRNKKMERSPRWKESLIRSKTMFKEAGIKLRYISLSKSLVTK